MAVLTHFILGYWRDSTCSGLLTCPGSLFNQSETMKASKEVSGTSKTAKMAKRGIFKGDSSLKVMEEPRV